MRMSLLGQEKSYSDVVSQDKHFSPDALMRLAVSHHGKACNTPDRVNVA